MFVSQQLKQRNIAEYLIYMWQVEDLIRANHCDMEQIQCNIVDHYPSLSDEQRTELSQWYEDLIEMIEGCASCPLYSLLKRQDEKYVTEKAWENPRFVEDVLREVVLKMRNNPVVTEFEVDCEALESIHNHSAWAYQKEIK